MQFSHFDDDTAYMLRAVCREVFDILVLEGDPATSTAREPTTKDIIARHVLAAVEAGERNRDRLCTMALKGTRTPIVSKLSGDQHDSSDLSA